MPVAITYKTTCFFCYSDGEIATMRFAFISNSLPKPNCYCKCTASVYLKALILPELKLQILNSNRTGVIPTVVNWAFQTLVVYSSSCLEE